MPYSKHYYYSYGDSQLSHPAQQIKPKFCVACVLTGCHCSTVQVTCLLLVSTVTHWATRFGLFVHHQAVSVNSTSTKKQIKSTHRGIWG
jgi:hypothetical protein